MTLTLHQQSVFDQIQQFLDREGPRVFILKGYAGTGKTFLMQHLAQQLAEQKRGFSLHASTGRAATVLKAKTNYKTSTVHSELYEFNKVDGDYEHLNEDAAVDAFGQMLLIFELRKPDSGSDKVYVVDEASMISDMDNNGSSYATFGSGRLLSDLMSVAGHNKIIFTGDPCQLPPVFGLENPALSEKWFQRAGYQVQSAELTEIIRHQSGNNILDISSRVRKMVQNIPPEKFPKIPARDLEGEQIHLPKEYNILKEYLNFLDSHGMYQSIAIAQSNKYCHFINRAIRHHRFGDADMMLMPGDLLMVTQNNYVVPLTNGDPVEVVSLYEKRNYCQLSFINARVKALVSGLEYEILICLDTLSTGSPNITQDQQRNLMIDFAMKMRHRRIKPNSEQYRDNLSKDPYLNSLRVSYGYAITCHKAQGGEWDQVFLFLNKFMFGMGKENLLRWWYTGITRAKKELFMADDLIWIR